MHSAYKLFCFVAIISLGFATPTQAAQNQDALTSASSGIAKPAYSGAILEGPNVLAGSSLAVGQTLRFLITVTNPWTNNTVAMQIASPLEGMQLTPQSTQQAEPSWVLTWTPTSSEVGAQNVTFLTSFNQTNGVSQVFQPGLIIKVSGSGATSSDASAIKSLTISKATWQNAIGLLTVSGKVNVKPGKKTPAQTRVILTSGSGSPLDVVEASTVNGSWATTLNLLQGDNPCLVSGSVIVADTETSAIANRKVTGKALSCQP